MKKMNDTYAYGMLVLGILCFLAGFITMKMNPGSPYGLGTLFLGLFLEIQYLKAMNRVSAYIIRILTWVVVFGFFAVDILIIYYWMRGRLL
ncbi:hypothetical protein [Petroclostridium sp. X23]|uniref:hypothetical protein n=1 Tax=Petroclostridium sp. X23 TaxID=3045146 RepID=UPI0024ACB8BD|nr:hypothetical protein [Petroclostridium sp. X23]WHH57087.1 hypothetical protein QKW49_14695 [Petroclostridium sp. X23]